jgi:AbrB family looped-hinge helix DNA binding protein
MPKIMTVGPKGQVVIPAEYREALGIHPGDEVVFEQDGAALRLTSRRAVLKRLRGAFADLSQSLSEELLQERCEEVEQKAW